MRSLLLTLSFLIMAGSLFAQNPADCKASHDSIDGVKVMMVTEEMAKYKSGEHEMMRTILDSIQYPKGKKPAGNKVVVEWVVDTLGNVRNPCILKTLAGDAKLSSFETEILRVVSQLKDWVPAKHKGKKVPVLILLPIIIDWRE